MPSTLYSYRLFLDWGTSFLWNKCTDPDDDPVVEGEEIEDRYPCLAEFYFEWVQIYDESFRRQECHLSSYLPVFAKVDELVAWETEGFLLACWLALQDDVREFALNYNHSSAYHLRKGQLEKELAQFLIYMEEFLLKYQGHEFFLESD
jgi:hypothetical protein